MIKLSHKDYVKLCMDLIFDRGYDHVTAEDLYKHCGIGRSTFYYHFPTKDRILLEYYLSDFTLTPERIAWALEGASHWERLLRTHLMMPIHNTKEGSLDTIRRVQAYMITHPGEELIKKMADDTHRLTIPLIRKAQEAGEIRNPSAPELIAELTGTIQQGLVIEWLRHNGQMDMIAALAEELETLYAPIPELCGLTPWKTISDLTL